mgnify:CR=1 FL=1
MAYKPNYPVVGLNNVGSYQVSGEPFASGSIRCSDPNGAQCITFPYVTRWVLIVNNDTNNACRVGFSKNGVDGLVDNFYFRVPAQSDSYVMPPLELKVTELWISGSNDVDIVAGLTGIERQRTSGSIGPSWSGSFGVG